MPIWICTKVGLLILYACAGEKPRPPPYVPPPPPEDEEEIFKSMQKGINFDKYDEIPVECSGNNHPKKGIET